MDRNEAAVLVREIDLELVSPSIMTPNHEGTDAYAAAFTTGLKADGIRVGLL